MSIDLEHLAHTAQMLSDTINELQKDLNKLKKHSANILKETNPENENGLSRGNLSDTEKLLGELGLENFSVTQYYFDDIVTHIKQGSTYIGRTFNSIQYEFIVEDDDYPKTIEHILLNDNGLFYLSPKYLVKFTHISEKSIEQLQSDESCVGVLNDLFKGTIRELAEYVILHNLESYMFINSDVKVLRRVPIAGKSVNILIG